MRWIPLAVVLFALVLVLPVWSWSRGWGWAPAGMVGITAVTILLFTFAVVPT